LRARCLLPIRTFPQQSIRHRNEKIPPLGPDRASFPLRAFKSHRCTDVREAPPPPLSTPSFFPPKLRADQILAMKRLTFCRPLIALWPLRLRSPSLKITPFLSVFPFIPLLTFLLAAFQSGRIPFAEERLSEQLDPLPNRGSITPLLFRQSSGFFFFHLVDMG